MRTWTAVVGLVSLAMAQGCKDKTASASGAPSAAPGVASASGASAPAGGGCPAGAQKIDPVGYCIALPSGYTRDDKAFEDAVLKEMGGDKNIWFSADKQSQITVTYKPGADDYESELGFMQSALKSDSYKQPVDAPADTASGKGKFIASSDKDGKTKYLDSVSKSSKFVIRCKASTPSDDAALAACKGLTPPD